MRIGHIADCHLGLGYPGPRPESRLTDIENVMDFAAEYFIEHDVELVLFAGDAFKDSKVLLDRAAIEIKAFASWLRKLSEAEIPVVVISGTPSHDAIAAYEIIREMHIPDVQIVTKPGIIDIGPGQYDTKGISVACIPGLNRSALASKEEYAGLTPRQMHQVMSEKIKELAWGLAAQINGPNVLLSHLTFAGSDTGFDEMLLTHEPVLTPEAVEPFGLVCLGHIHNHQQIGKVFYAGSPDRLTFNDEQMTPGFWVHDTEQHDFIETPARTFTTLLGNFSQDPSLFGFPTAVKDAIVRCKFSMTEEQAREFNRKEYEKRLYEAGAFHVAGITLDVERADRARNADVTESIGPVEAVGKWGADNGIPESDITGLQGLTGDLLEEVTA